MAIIDFIVHVECHRRNDKNHNFIEKDATHQFHLINNVWFEVEIADLPPKFPRESYRLFHDLVLGNQTRWDLSMYYGKEVYAIKKRQLNKKEIKKLKLWETPLGNRKTG